MASLHILLFFSIICFSIYSSTSSNEPCPAYFCGSNDFLVRFPFGLKDTTLNRCMYPKFELSCQNDTQIILNLPSSGDFIVKFIDYINQAVYISDTDSCLPERFLRNFSLSGSPFTATPLRNYNFFNCSKDATVRPIPCLSGANFSVILFPTSYPYRVGLNLSNCIQIANVSIPARMGVSIDFTDVVRLNWDKPSCGSCQKNGGVCGFKSDSGLDVGCSGDASHGLPRAAKYGITIGVGIPGLLCLTIIVCYACGKMRRQGRQPYSISEFPTIITQPHPAIVVFGGLDRPTIESYPKTVLGESGRLPKPNDDTCPICFSEYKPKETLRTIPECNHYFHAHCIDEWLKLNATCPLCRKSPDGS